MSPSPFDWTTGFLDSKCWYRSPFTLPLKIATVRWNPKWPISWSLRLSGISSRYNFLHQSTVQVLLWLTCLWTFFQALSIVHTIADHLFAYFLLAMLTHRVSDQYQAFGFWMQTSKPKPCFLVVVFFFLKQTGRLPVLTNSHLTLQLRRPSLMWVGRSVV